ncbi:ABC transporter ATP-binding protein [Curtobacterium sp. MCLR17_034]|nr:ABC transporter ATP-binding protein [Curtobacterium sp. MCLR17_034]
MPDDREPEPSPAGNRTTSPAGTIPRSDDAETTAPADPPRPPGGEAGPMPESPAIEVQHLGKQYATGKRAVDDVSFTIERGETFALLGPNGAGKSTTVEILEGYRSRTAGEVRVLGHDPARTSRSHNARIGIVLQTSAESPNVTVAEQLNHFATLYPKHRSVEELLTATGLETQRNTRISRLSGGQRRRVDVALGIIGRPEVLFLDEPTTGFDPEARRQFWDLLRQVQHEGTTILLTTHYLDEAAQLADRAAVIADGKLLDLAPIDEIGGAEARTPRVRWRDDDGGHHDERTTDPTALIRSSTTPMHDLEVIRPSLEDVYLDMVGQQ